MPPSKKSSSECTVEAVGRIFQQIHKSAAHAQKCKTSLLDYAEKSQPELMDAVSRVALLVLKESPQLAPEALKRHYNFLSELCRGFRDRCESDELAITLLETVVPFHNANDKTVRLGVVSLFDALLRTVDQANTSEERQSFYQRAAEMLKCRAHDRHPPVRERAVAAVGCFQTGRKDCDVTQQLLALLCTDSAADVRRQILRGITARKEFLEGYFHGMTRCARDVVARVRAEAWDALGRFHWKYIAAYAAAKSVGLVELLATGLADANSSVAIACRAALTNCWMHRDYHDDYAALLELVVGGAATTPLAPFDAICRELLLHRQRHGGPTHYALDLDNTPVNATALMLWRASAKLAADADAADGGPDDATVLLPLPQFAALLQDTVYAYARPDAVPKTVKFRNTDEADIMLRVLLSAFEVYEENGYLTHADNTTRGGLLRILGFLLKVVPDDDPALFVDVAVRSLRALTERTPEEASRAITAALDSLFRSLRLPQRYGLGYDDVEAFARKSRERQRELLRRRMLLRSGEVTQGDYDELKEEMDRDEKFLLRMQFIVLAFLSHAQRGEGIPSFCSHVIQLGRQQDSEAVRVTSTTSLGLQCLISPDAVHTFMPLILADTSAPVGADEMHSDRCVPAAALAVAFDLVAEYGLRFFDAPTRTANVTTNPTSHVNAMMGNYNHEGFDDVTVEDTSLATRLEHERNIAQEDEHRIGGGNLLQSLRSFLRGHCPVRRSLAIIGFCKLLSCNRVPQPLVAEVLAEILLHHASYRGEDRPSVTTVYMLDYISRFLHSFAASHAQRQSAFAHGGLCATRVLLTYSCAAATRTAELVTRLADAFVLVQVRDIDPDAARHAARLADGPSAEESTLQRNATARSALTRASLQSGRLARELSRFSLHESIAAELLLELALHPRPEAQAVCMDVLERRMYFYAREAPSWLLYCAARAVEAVCGDALRVRLCAWRDGVAARGVQTPADGDGNAHEAKWQEAVEARRQFMEKMAEDDFADTLCRPLRVGAAQMMGDGITTVKEEVKRQRDTDNSAFDIESIMGSRKRARR